MNEKVILNKIQVKELTTFVDNKLNKSECDHSLKWTIKWANNHQINKDDLIDVLDGCGAYCDCEIVLNLPATIDLILEDSKAKVDSENPYKIPVNYEIQKDRLYSKAVYSKSSLCKKCYATDGEIIFPSPQLFKPKKRMRKLSHYFNGIESELPSELGIVKSLEPITAIEFAKQLRDTKLESLKKVKEREADFYLSQVDKFELDTIVAINIFERMRNYKKQDELKIHKIILSTK